MQNKVAIPERYDIFMQDLTKPYIELKFMGYVKTIQEAVTMCKVLKEADKDLVDRGFHTYLFRCGAIKGA